MKSSSEGHTDDTCGDHGQSPPPWEHGGGSSTVPQRGPGAIFLLIRVTWQSARWTPPRIVLCPSQHSGASEGTLTPGFFVSEGWVWGPGPLPVIPANWKAGSVLGQCCLGPVVLGAIWTTPAVLRGVGAVWYSGFNTASTQLEKLELSSSPFQIFLFANLPELNGWSFLKGQCRWGLSTHFFFVLCQ